MSTPQITHPQASHRGEPAAAAQPVPTAGVAQCCPPVEQATCCEPAAKKSCCGAAATSGGGCGCR